MNRTIVIGLGNPILGDDSIGWRVAEAAAGRLEAVPGMLRLRSACLEPPAGILSDSRRIAGGRQDASTGSACQMSQPELVEGPARQEVEVDCLSAGGLALMERLEGYDAAVLIDALTGSQSPPGEVMRLELGDLPELAGSYTRSAHDTGLPEALQIGRRLGARLPERIGIVAVAVQPTFQFSEQLSPEVGAAVPTAVAMVLEILEEMAVS